MTASEELPNLAWHAMSPREQAIWGAAMVAQGEPTCAGARAADRFVLALRALVLDGGNPGPEYDAARAQVGLSRPEFESWYRVQLQIQFAGTSRGRNLSSEDCAAAFERYLMGRGDFY